MMDEKIRKYLQWLDSKCAEAERATELSLDSSYDDGRFDAYGRAKCEFVHIFGVKDGE
ncbi:MAG: hypothetical protein KHY04_01070 [Bifidobacterium catenulatum]|nr:hypothetical protein [Bifidobacterium catenulatum]MBS5344956.1 hypothetical protein [Bifidobacterium catenulatum]